VPKPPIEAQPLSDALAPATMKARRVIDMANPKLQSALFIVLAGRRKCPACRV
jgi:hypothetical protein